MHHLLLNLRRLHVDRNKQVLAERSTTQKRSQLDITLKLHRADNNFGQTETRQNYWPIYFTSKIKLLRTIQA